MFSQRFEGYTLHVSALFEQVVVSWARPGQAQREAALARGTLDNRWHWLALRYRPAPPSLLLEVDKDTQVSYCWGPADTQTTSEENPLQETMRSTSAHDRWFHEYTYTTGAS